MNKLIFATIAMHALFLSPSCKSKKHYSYLNENQHALLDVPQTGRTLTFNENGQLVTLEIGVLNIGMHLQEEVKGGMYTPGSMYYVEGGRLYYNESNGNPRLFIEAYSENPYRPESGKARQTIGIFKNGYSTPCTIDFDNRLRSRKIGDITYSHIVLGTTSNGDTLYWKEGLGVLGWKRTEENYTVYRVN